MQILTATVFDGHEILGLITGETIARWIAYQLEKDELVMSEPVIEVMKHAEDPDNWTVLESQATIYDAKDRFDQAFVARKSLDAIIVTTNGRKTSPPVGIITIFDYPELTGQNGPAN